MLCDNSEVEDKSSHIVLYDNSTKIATNFLVGDFSITQIQKIVNRL